MTHNIHFLNIENYFMDYSLFKEAGVHWEEDLQKAAQNGFRKQEAYRLVPGRWSGGIEAEMTGGTQTRRRRS